jgi:peroxiredoxin
MRPVTLLIGLCAITVVAVSGYLGLKSAGLEQVPDITLVTTRGERIALASMRGNPLLVTFWATTCPSCMKEMPQLIDLYHELSPLGLKVIGIAMYYDPPNRVLAIQKSRSIPYTIALDIDAHAARAFGDVEVTPTTFLIAPDGQVVYQKTGHMDMDRLRNAILALLKTSPTSPPVSAGGHS